MRWVGLLCPQKGITGKHMYVLIHNYVIFVFKQKTDTKRACGLGELASLAKRNHGFFVINNRLMDMWLKQR